MHYAELLFELFRQVEYTKGCVSIQQTIKTYSAVGALQFVFTFEMAGPLVT